MLSCHQRWNLRLLYPYIYQSPLSTLFCTSETGGFSFVCCLCLGRWRHQGNEVILSLYDADRESLTIWSIMIGIFLYDAVLAERERESLILGWAQRRYKSKSRTCVSYTMMYKWLILHQMEWIHARIHFSFPCWFQSSKLSQSGKFCHWWCRRKKTLWVCNMIFISNYRHI